MVTDEQAFSTLLVAIEPWLDRVVIVGGWACRLYRFHPAAQPLDYAALMTLDADVAIPAKLTERPAELRQRLLMAGFHEEFLGEDRPPATHYHLRGGTGFYAEFLSPLTGPAHDRSGRRKATLNVAGVAVQRLRHIDLLLELPWEVKLKRKGFSGRVRIANPVSYLVQKLLIHRERQPADRAKDILYMHDTLEVFGSSLEQLQALWQTEIAVRLSRPKAGLVTNMVRDIFGRRNDDLRRAALVSAERRLTAEAIREACEYGFAQVLGAAARHAGKAV